MTEEKQRRHRFSKKSVITLLSSVNPKREGTLAHTRFALYRTGMTIGEYINAGGRPGDIKHDLAFKHIELTVPSAA
jgi:hypothetical protein